MVDSQYKLLGAYFILANLFAFYQFFNQDNESTSLAIFYLVFGICNFIADVLLIAIMILIFCALRKLYLNSKGDTYTSKGQTRVTLLTVCLTSLLVLNVTLNSIGRTVASYIFQTHQMTVKDVNVLLLGL